MILKPQTREELASALHEAHASRQAVERVDLDALNRLVDHTPDDMTATVESGMTVADLQRDLASGGQWLPIDPPSPEGLTIGELLAHNESGPRRFGYGPIREHLIGLTVALADGQYARSGGRVVKNVAGYDLMKLFVGSRGTLGVIVEATFRLLPLPRKERILKQACASLEGAEATCDAVMRSELRPVALDLQRRASSSPSHDEDGPLDLVTAFAGSPEEVDWQVELAQALGIEEPADLTYDREFRREAQGLSPLRKLSVLPSQTVAEARALEGAPFVARLGNGLLYYRSDIAPRRTGIPDRWIQRVKETFDPRAIFPRLQL